LFIQGAGEGAHREDARLVYSLTRELGQEYEIRYPAMPNEDSPDDAAWKQRLAAELTAMGEGAILVGHSAGGASLLAFLAENNHRQTIAGAFLIAAPFFGKAGWDCGDANLPKDIGARIQRGLPMFLYHGRQDEIVPFAHVALLAEALPQALVRHLDGRNHQLNDDLFEVATDILSLG
jgi:predicted alpha/beta hydrolase family esterase